MAATVLFTAEDGSVQVRVRAGNRPAVIDDGYARWETIQRDGRESLTDFAGVEPYRQTVPILFDGWEGTIGESRSVESDIRLLERLAVVPEKATHPPIVRIAGNVRRTDLKWVIQGPIEWADGDWDEFIATPVTGERYRQAATVRLLKYEPDEQLSEKDARPRDSKGRLLRPTRVRAGERSFRDVSKRVYRTRNRARDIARVNDLPLSTRLVKDQLIYLPAK